ncbi:MAG: aminotransferase [Alphaproteobacteria bacterium]|nr:aminotransferase [Alphaproteobacteria bacterium]
MFPASIIATPAPPIPAVRAWAARYAGAAPLLDVTQAVPGYPAHPELLARIGRAAGDAAFAGYGAIEGDAELRSAFAADVAGFYGAPITPDQVAITAGCNLAFAMVMATLAGPGARVGLPTPWYFNHQMTLLMQGAEPVPIPCRAEDGFIPDPARIAPLLDGLSTLVLVSPNNPTGAIYPPETLHEIAALCRARGVWLVLDETYRDFLPGAAPHALFSAPDWPAHLVHLYSFSKAYCVPGHRLGAVLAGGAAREALMKALDSYQICPARPAQAALSWGVPALAEWRAGNRAIMAERAQAARAALSQVPGWRLDSLGAYFAYLRVPEDGPDALAVAEKLAVERGLLCLPGPFFGPGQERHLRLAFANVELARIREIPTRLA